MDNSNTTASINTSKSTTTPKFIPAASQATFAIGDVVLCPSLSSQPFELTADPYGKRDELTLTFEGSYFYYDANGCFIRADDHETGDFQPSLYHNTPANQQAINTLYGNTSSTLATFKAGDAVLCPRFGGDSHQLFIDDEDGFLSFIVGVNKFHTRADGKLSPNDKSPSIFHDTPSNRQIIAALYDQAAPSQRKLIDTTSADDDEVVLLKSSKILNNAGELSGAIDVLDDMSSLLGLIYNSKLSQSDTQSLARLTQTTVDTWAEILNTQLERLNEVLTLTKFIKVGE